jgi:hypothetical protein
MRRGRRTAVYPLINIVVQIEEGGQMLAIIRMESLSRNYRHLGTASTLVIGRREEPADDDEEIWICQGRRALSRRSVVLVNTGTELKICNEQNPATGEVWLENRSGEKWRLGREPYPLLPKRQVILTIIPRDGNGEIRFVLTAQGEGKPDPGRTDLHEELDDEDPRVLLVNAIALACANLPEGSLVTPKSVKDYFLPAVGAATGYDRKFDNVASQLCIRYGLDDRRGLLDLLRVGRAKGDVRDTVMRRLNKVGTDG